MASGLHCISNSYSDTSQQINTTTWAMPPSSELLYSINSASPLLYKKGTTHKISILEQKQEGDSVLHTNMLER
jgi:hypothetical protein